jgi:hypothetical protein
MRNPILSSTNIPHYSHIGELNQAVLGLAHILTGLKHVTAQLNTTYATAVVTQRLADEAAGNPLLVFGWYEEVSRQLSHELRLPLRQARQLAHQALCHLALLPIEDDGDTEIDFHTSAPLILVARQRVTREE